MDGAAPLPELHRTLCRSQRTGARSNQNRRFNYSPPTTASLAFWGLADCRQSSSEILAAQLTPFTASGGGQFYKTWQPRQQLHTPSTPRYEGQFRRQFVQHIPRRITSPEEMDTVSLLISPLSVCKVNQ